MTEDEVRKLTDAEFDKYVTEEDSKPCGLTVGELKVLVASACATIVASIGEHYATGGERKGGQ